MLRLHRAGLAALMLGVAVAAAAEKPTEPTSWWQARRGEPRPKPAVKADAAPIDRAAEQARLEKAYLRRQAVCDRLREVALEGNDGKLADEAARLEEAAWKLFQARSDRLMSGGGVDEPKGGAVFDETRDMLLDHAKKKREARR
ncbi:MAG: hypothetical protein ACRC33_20255 [Gemmataceae bacterium]